MRIAQQLLEGHGFQLQRGRPHYPLPLTQMGPRQRLPRQVPQALHEGRVALVKAWAHQGIFVQKARKESNGIRGK
jgi:hypothetical protein